MDKGVLHPDPVCFVNDLCGPKKSFRQHTLRLSLSDGAKSIKTFSCIMENITTLKWSSCVTSDKSFPISCLCAIKSLTILNFQ